MNIKQNTITLEAILEQVNSLPEAGTGGGNTDELMIGIAERTLTDLVLPEGVVNVAANAFYQWKTIETISFPSTLETISDYGFKTCSGVRELTFPSSLKEIKRYAFNGSTGLRTVTFKGTPTTLATNVFDACINITTINVPWAEGEVANAPWGATYATINYNSAV